MNAFDMERRVLALQQSLDDILNDRLGRNVFPLAEVQSYFRDYAGIRQQLRLQGGRYAGIPVCRDGAYSDEYQTTKSVDRTKVEALLRGVRHVLAVLPDETPVAEILSREGFYFRGQSFEALLAATRIIDAATSSVDIIDGYVSTATLGLVGKLKGTAQIRILTRKTKDSSSIAFVTIAQAYNSDGGNLEVRFSDDFHDRFIIVDGSELYHFGASLKDLAKGGFMFSRIEERPVIEALLRTVNDAWSRASVLADVRKPGVTSVTPTPPVH
jgi:hypothetical protein